MKTATLATGARLEPFPHFLALDGCHCITNSLAKMYRFYGHPLSEEMLLGLGAGMGFVYWRMKMGGTETVFVGGRGNNKGFYQDLGKRTGVTIREIQTGSDKKTEAELLRQLAEKKPVMLGSDMGLLPWFKFPTDYHFGGHTFVVCGHDGDQVVLGSDIDQHGGGLKKGFCAPITLEQLRKARGSTFKPFPPKNLRLDFDFGHARKPTAKEVVAAIKQMVDAQLRPPIRNLGVSGMRHTADQLLLWPDQFKDHDLRMNLFMLYVFVEIGGTGGGCFRAMYSRFLRECAQVIGNRSLLKGAESFEKIGKEFSRIALMLKDAQKMSDLRGPIQVAAAGFRTIADQEEAACRFLEGCI